MSKFVRQSARLSLNRFIGTALALAAWFVAPVVKAQLPSVVTYGQREAYPLPSGAANLSYLARDAQGDIFVMSASTARIDEIPVNGPAVTVVPVGDAALTASQGANDSGFAVDPAGNIYVFGKFNGAITKVPRASNGTYTLTAETTVTSSFSALNNNNSYGISDLAVDSLGNIYLATNSGHANATTGWTGTGLLASGPSFPGGRYLAQYAAYNSSTSPTYPNQVAVDGAGNVYYSDTTHAYEILQNSALGNTPVSTQIGFNGTGTCPGCTTLPATITNVFLDPLGNVYVVSAAAQSFYVLPNSGSSFNTSSTTYAIPGAATKSSYNYGTVNNQGELIEIFGGSLEKYGISYYAGNTGATAVGTASNGFTTYFLFTQTVTLKATGALTLTGTGPAYGGAALTSGLSFSGTATCTSGTTYTPGQTCAAGINYKSQFPGAYSFVLSMLGTSGNTLAQFVGSGTATGAAVTVDGASKTIGTGYVSPAGVAVDNTGAIYVADPDANAVYKYAAGSTAAGTAVGTGLSLPSGVAVDASGDIFIADTGNDRVVAISGGTQTVVSTPGYSLSSPRGVSLDMTGNLYIADTGNARVLEIANPFAGEPTITQVLGFTGLVSPYAVAFGPFNDIYVADKGANAVFMIGAFGTNSSTFTYVSPSSQITVGSGFNGPTGVAVDASGSVYVADSGNARIVKVPSISSAYTYGTQTVMYSGLSKPFGIATDTTSDLYYTDMNAPAVFFTLRSAATTGTAATIPFGTVATGSTGNQTATVTNSGLSTSLTIASVTEPTTPFGGSTTCGATLTPGSSCAVALTYGPTSAGTATPGTLTLTDNALGVTNATQNVTLTGAASGTVASVTVTGASTVVYGESSVFTVTAKDASGIAAVAGNGTYTVNITGAATTTTSVTVNGGTGTFNLPSLGAGAYNLAITIGGFQGTASVTVSKAPLYITPANVTRAFDSPTSALATPIYSGFGNGDTASTVVTTNATASASVTRLTPYGNYPITASGAVLTTAGAANYTPVYVAGIYAVTGSVPQSIVFPTLPGFKSGATTYTLTGQATSGLPLTYVVSSGAATISGNVLTVSSPGAVTITAVQAGNSTYSAATSVSRSFTAQ